MSSIFLRTMQESGKCIETLAVHAGRQANNGTGAVVPPITLSTTFKQLEPCVPTFKYEYSRSNNPNREIFEDAVAALEKAKYGIAFASGLAANTTIMHLLPKNSKILMINDVYGGTFRFFNSCAVPLGYKLACIDLSSPDLKEVYSLLETELSPETSLLWIESPTNPTLRICQIEPIIKYVKDREPNVICVVDNTFLTPVYQRPLELGADIVVHSVSKYLNGHSDVIMGVGCVNDDTLGLRLRTLQNSLGTIPDPFNCWLASRGLQTLILRMQRISDNALKISEWLSGPTCTQWVRAVYYPGLPSHPGHEALKKQQKAQGIAVPGFSGMISFVLNTDNLQKIKSFSAAGKIICLAESLGSVESLIEVPALMTHASVPAATRIKLGIKDSLIRLSVGIESVDDLIADLKQAFLKIFAI